MPKIAKYRTNQYNTTDHEYEIKSQRPSTAVKRIIPKDRIRAMALARKGQPSAKCNFCHERFQMYYIRMCKLGLFGPEEFVCQDCRHERRLQTAD